MTGSSLRRRDERADFVLREETPERAPGGSVAEMLIRRLRVSDTPERFQRLATETTREALGVEAVAWVPHGRRDAPVVAGAVEGLDGEGYRRLLPDPSGSVWISGSGSAARMHEAARRVAVAAATGEGDHPVGWLLAVNPLGGSQFGPEVRELLPVVAGLVAAQRNNARLYAEIKELLFGVIGALTSAIDAKDPYTCGHSERVARIAVRLGEQLGVNTGLRCDLYLMGLLHDVGKIGIEDGVLKKADRLTPDEYRTIQAHVRIGIHILSGLKKLSHLLPGIAHHHESWDGSGYPAGLAGEQIPLPARILAVADAYDAMSSSRPYRPRLSATEIDANFRAGAGGQWDPKVVAALFECRDDLERIRQKGLGKSLMDAVGRIPDA
jgi:HD-GYP domain-containing protein (c-di-GMP phosphodiesterase class II)